MAPVLMARNRLPETPNDVAIPVLPEVAVESKVQVVSGPLAADDPTSTEESLADVTSRIHNYHMLRDEKLVNGPVHKLAQAWPTRDEHFTMLLSAPFRAVFKRKRLEIAGSKQPMYEEVVDIDRLREDLGSLKILHIVRNPVDTVASSLNRRNLTRLGQDLWHVQHVKDACLEWALAWHQMLARKSKDGDQMLIIKYEDLVADFDRVAGTIAEFLEIEPGFQNIADSLPPELARRSLHEDETAYVEAMFGDIDKVWHKADLPRLFAQFPIVPPPYILGEQVDFSDGGNGCHYLHTGFAIPEEWGTWTDGAQAIMTLRVPETKPLTMSLDFQLFARESAAPAAFYLKANGKFVGQFSIASSKWGEEFSADFFIPPEVIKQNVLKLEFSVANFRAEHEDAGDPRLLGVGLRRMTIVAADGDSAKERSEENIAPFKIVAAKKYLRMGILSKTAARRELTRALLSKQT